MQYCFVLVLIKKFFFRNIYNVKDSNLILTFTVAMIL